MDIGHMVKQTDRKHKMNTDSCDGLLCLLYWAQWRRKISEWSSAVANPHRGRL